MNLKQNKIFFVAFLAFCVFYLSACSKIKQREYYKDENNYLTSNAVVKEIIYKNEDNGIYLWLDHLDSAYQDSTFVLRGENVNIAIENGITNKVSTGTEITFTSAPRYFWDGYLMPIVYLKVNDEVLLHFKEGYGNLLDML